VTYLELCQALVSELGLSSGTGPVSVTGNTILELQNATRWIRDAALSIDNRWNDWKYLWRTYTGSVNVGGTGLPLAGSTVRTWDINRLRYKRTSSTDTWQRAVWMARARLFQEYDPDNAVAAPPEVFTIDPGNTITFAAPLDAGYDFRGEYWCRPIPLVANADVPLIPPEYHRVIVCRAAVMYGNREDAPEIIAGLSAEHDDIMDKLQSDQLEGFELRRQSVDRQQPEAQTGYQQFLR